MKKQPERKPRRIPQQRKTKLERFCTKEDVSLYHLSKMGVASPRYLMSLRVGLNEPTLSMMVGMAQGLSRMLGRKVMVTELFDFRGYA